MHRYLDEEAYNRILHFEQEERTPLVNNLDLLKYLHMIALVINNKGVDAPSVFLCHPPSFVYQGILQEMHRYLDEEAYNRILHFEQEERTPLDEMNNDIS
jgi:hypothetical protein